MIKLLNKILAKFELELISTKVDVSLVEDAVKFMNTIPKSYLTEDRFLSPYVGDINYVKERVWGEFPQVSGTTYFEESYYGMNKKFFNFDGEKLDEKELIEKLNND